MLDIRKAMVLSLAIAAMISVAAGPAGARTRAHRAGASPARFNIENYSTFTPGQIPSVAHRYSVLVLYAHEARWVPLLRRYNPHALILMYQFPGFATVSDPTGGMDCTSVTQGLTQGWLTRSRLGVPISLSGRYFIDVANPAFQQACVSHAVALAKQGGFDGLFFDGADEKFSFEVPSAVVASAAHPPSDSAWQTAVYSLLSRAGQAAHASGLRMFANIGGGDPGLWRKWNGVLDGAMEESWTDGGDGLSQQLPWWRDKLDNVAWSEAHGKYVLLHSYNLSESGNAFGLAAMLLVADGHTSYSTSNPSVPGGQQWFSEYAAAKRLGRALGSYRIRRSGVYVRVFAHGIVLVNPGLRTVRGVSLGRRYSGSGRRRVRRVSLSPLSGLILLRAG